MTCVQTTSLGAYVLGALDTEDRQETERHLRDCPLCRDELVQLAPLPGLLGQVELSDLVAIEAEPWTEVGPPPSSALTPAGRWRRARRALGTAAAVAALAVGTVVAGRVVVGDPAAPTAAAATWTATDAGDIGASAVLSDRAWGTDITLTMDHLPPGQRCRLVVRSVDGRTETAGWWTTGYASTAEVPASTSIGLAAVDRLEVVRADGKVLAVLTPST